MHSNAQLDWPAKHLELRRRRRSSIKRARLSVQIVGATQFVPMSELSELRTVQLSAFPSNGARVCVFYGSKTAMIDPESRVASLRSLWSLLSLLRLQARAFEAFEASEASEGCRFKCTNSAGRVRARIVRTTLEFGQPSNPSLLLLLLLLQWPH